MVKISVIMPCYNAEAHVVRGVSSVLGQTYRSVELIAVNDGSKDRTANILSRIGDVRLKVINQPRLGVSAARNRGLAEATGVFVAFLDADDTWRSDCLELLHAALEKAPEAVLSYCGWQNVGLPGGRGEPYIPPDYEDENKLEHLLKCCPWPIHAALVKRNALESVGRFNERFSHAEDYAVWLRVAAFQKIVCVPEVMAYYHFHGEAQATKDRGKTAYGQFRVQSEFLKYFPEVQQYVGRKTVRRLVYGGLLREGFACYWDRDIETARAIFRTVMRAGYGTRREWKYLLPALLPLRLHKRLIELLSREGDSRRWAL